MEMMTRSVCDKIEKYPSLSMVIGCQNRALLMPTGWTVAPNNTDVMDGMVMRF